ncbi:PucR family transcriptional regulator [Paenibacillus pasadenensis]|uniref:PucR family transcriptional regulator n=1 Tax=Paenibacillus pasadenensis TaxID=217090 RepID=UPI00203DBB46|nr:PucR family transcriptional regulator [Paenibacillus pasadenensis]MCM3745826.1 PucR family transcriptional regulator [Paenibacillus pasadenensis]
MNDNWNPVDQALPRSLTVRETLMSDLFAGARVEAGHAGLDREIRWVHVLEVTGVTELLHGGEMVLTTGVGIGACLEKQELFITSLLQGEAACLCLELGPGLSVLPPKWKKQADRHAMPLIVFPHTVRYVDITHELHSIILNRRRAYQEALALESAQRNADSRMLRLLLDNSWGAPGADSAQDALLKDAADSMIGALDGMNCKIVAAEWLAGSGNRSAQAAAELAADELRRKMRSAGCLCIADAEGGRMTALIAQPERAAAVRLRLEELAVDVLAASVPGFCCGASSRFSSRSRAGEAKRQALEALKLNRSMLTARVRSMGTAESRQILSYDELGVLQLLPSLLESGRLEPYVQDHLGPLIQADRLRGGDLLMTLKVFLDCDGSKQEAARRLFIVRQSLYYRLERIQELIGPVWADCEKRLAVQIALRAYMLLEPGALPAVPIPRSGSSNAKAGAAQR